MIWAMPARRPGASWQKSTIQRLCAFSPAHRRSYSSGDGCGATRFPDGKNGGMVLGNSTSATTPSASSSAIRRLLLKLRSKSEPCRSSNGLT